MDDYDETLLETPTNLSVIGMIGNGEITWDLDPMVAGDSMLVTYEADIKPLMSMGEGELPAYTEFTCVGDAGSVTSNT